MELGVRAGRSFRPTAPFESTRNKNKKTSPFCSILRHLTDWSHSSLNRTVSVRTKEKRQQIFDFSVSPLSHDPKYVEHENNSDASRLTILLFLFPKARIQCLSTTATIRLVLKYKHGRRWLSMSPDEKSG